MQPQSLPAALARHGCASCVSTTLLHSAAEPCHMQKMKSASAQATYCVHCAPPKGELLRGALTTTSRPEPVAAKQAVLGGRQMQSEEFKTLAKNLFAAHSLSPAAGIEPADQHRDTTASSSTSMLATCRSVAAASSACASNISTRPSLSRHKQLALVEREASY
jgi:hypothetical protein